MKRANRLVEKIAEPDNLRLAFWKAQRGKAGKEEVLRFRAELDKNLLALRHEILSGEVHVGDYHYFKVYDPKERLICASAFRERVLHHALMNVCHEHFERFQIFDSYACRLGKGTYAALSRAKAFHKKYAWFLKLDVRKYFYSIPHRVLKLRLRQRFKEGRLLNIFNAIIDSYEAAAGRGIPIGNLSSQYFANHYLAVADRYVKEQLRIPAYLRYMDDMVLWAADRQLLLLAGRRLEQFIGRELQLQFKPFCLNRSEKGLPFLGYLLYPHATRLGRVSRRRFCAKYAAYERKLEQGAWTQQEYQRHVLPLLAYTRHANAKEWRGTIIANNE